MKLEEINAETIRKETDAQVGNIHRHLHGLWAQHFEGNDKTTTDGITRELLVNKHVVVRADMGRRGMEHSEEARDGLDRAARELKTLDAALVGGSKDVVLVPKLVTVTGSVGEGRGNPDDLDVLVRADRVEREGGPGFFIRAEDLELPVRKRLDPEKTGLPIHWNANPQGPHDTHLALADLVLRWRVPAEREEVKVFLRAIAEDLAGKLGLSTSEAQDAFLDAVLKAGRRMRQVRVDQLREIWDAYAKLGEEIRDILEWGEYGDVPPFSLEGGLYLQRGETKQASPIVPVEFKPLCVCPECGEEAPSERGKTCEETACPECGHEMEPKAAAVEAVKAAPLRLTFVGTGAMNSRRRGAALLVERGKWRVQIDGEKPGDIQKNLDRLLITDPKAWNAEAAKEAGGEVAAFEGDGLAIKPLKVEHTSHDVWGYLIMAGGKKAAYIPEIWDWPAWAKDLDLAVVDGSAWRRDIRFAGGAGGHRSLGRLVSLAGDHNIKRIVATHIGNPTETALERREKIVGLEIAKDGQTVEIKAVSPGSRYTMMKPSMAGATEYFSTGELWDRWAGEKIKQGHPLLGSPKVDGFRSTISWDGDRVAVWFEDGKETRTPPGTPKLSGPPFTAEGEFTARRGGKWLARTQLAGAAAGKEEGAEPHFWLYDLLYYDGEDVSERPFRERLALLKKLRLPGKYFTVLAQRPVRDKGSLQAVGKWAAGRPLSEGLFVRQADAPYTFGSTDSAAKLKTVFELKVRVLEKKKTKDGRYSYRCGLRGSGFKNTVIVDGKEYVDLGWTFTTKD